MNILKNLVTWIIQNAFCFFYVLLVFFYVVLCGFIFFLRLGNLHFGVVVTILMACSLTAVVAFKIRGRARLITVGALILIAAYQTTWMLTTDNTTLVNYAMITAWCFFWVIVIGLLIATVHMHNTLRQQDPLTIYRWIVLGLLMAPLLFILHDDPPVTNDFRPEDAVCKWPDAEKSQEVLVMLEKNGKTIKISKPYIDNPPTNILPHAGGVEEAWREIGRGRDVIRKLNSFDRVADQTNPKVFSGAPYYIMNFVNYRSIARTYWSYAQLRLQQGRAEEGTRELVELHSVARKAVTNVTMTLSKMIWVALANGSIQCAYAMASDPQCNREVLQILREGFPPLPNESVILRMLFIGEYVYAREGVFLYRDGVRVPDFIMTPQGRRQLAKIPVWLRKAIILPNATAHLLRGWLIDPFLKESIDIKQSDEYMHKVVAHPTIRNVGGWIFFRVHALSFSRAANAVFECRVRSELLAVYLAERLGDTLALNDPCTGKPYKRNAQGVPFSVGRDGKAGTADDIKLQMKTP